VPPKKDKCTKEMTEGRDVQFAHVCVYISLQKSKFLKQQPKIYQNPTIYKPLAVKTFLSSSLLLEWALVAHAYNPSYSGGRDHEDHGLKPDQANSSQDPISKISITKMGWWIGSR
jgi:hypothetical protein